MRDPRARTGGEMGSDMPSPTITPVLVAQLLAEGDLMPVYVHVIQHPDARVLVDTGDAAAPGGGGHGSPPGSMDRTG